MEWLRGIGAMLAGGTGSRVAARSWADLVLPLFTLLGLGNRPGEAYRLGPLDPPCAASWPRSPPAAPSPSSASPSPMTTASLSAAAAHDPERYPA